MRGGRVRRVLGALACAVAAVALGAAPAAAHDEFLGSTPADGATVDRAPDRIVLTFAEPAVQLGTQVAVTGPDGTDLADGDAQLVDSTVVQRLVEARPAGRYTVDWRVTSDDGHPVTGSFAFTATNPASPVTPAASPTALAASPTTATADAQPSGWTTGNNAAGIVILIVVVLALVVVRIGRARSLRRKSGAQE